jgi:hypothetical protein
MASAMRSAFGAAALLTTLASASAKVQVVSAGLGRTGSSSLNEALAQLGHNVTLGIPEMFSEYLDEFKALNAGSLDAKGFIAKMDARGYTVVGYDMASTEFWRLAESMGLKIILTERDSPEVWATSVAATIASHGDLFTSRPFTFFESFRVAVPFMEEMLRIHGVTQDGEPAAARERMVRAYEKYSRDVKATVPRANLLVFNVKQGWRPLCEFLEVEACPTTPFPHVMTSFEMQVVTVVMRTVTWVWPLLPLVPLLLLWGAYRCVSRRRARRVKRE